MGGTEHADIMNFSFAGLVSRVTALQEDSAAAKQAHSRLEARCEGLQKQLEEAMTYVEDCKSKVKDMAAQCKRETDQLHNKV